MRARAQRRARRSDTDCRAHRAGLTHNVCSCWHPLFVLSDAYAQLGEELRCRGLQYLTAELVTATLYPDGEAAFLSRASQAVNGNLKGTHLGQE